MTVDDLEARFAAWLGARFGHPARVEPFVAPGHGGFSADTLVTVADWGAGAQRVVVRRAPVPGTELFPDAGLDRQAALLALLHDEGSVPVPVVIASEPDPEPLGRPFFVMAHVDGRIPPDRPGLHFAGWVKDELDAPAQARLLAAAIETLAAIHRVPVTPALRAAVGVPADGRDALERELGAWGEYLAWATDGVPPPVLADLHGALAATRPATATAALVWGDARLGNLVFGADLVVRAVLDWEMATLGPPALDLGWYLFLERVALAFTEQLPGFPDRAGIVARYEAAAGPVVDLDWYEAWGGFRTACIQLRLAARRGLPPPVAVERDPTLAVLRTLVAV